MLVTLLAPKSMFNNDLSSSTAEMPDTACILVHQVYAHQRSAGGLHKKKGRCSCDRRGPESMANVALCLPVLL